MKKVRRFYRRQDGVITTPSGVPVGDHLEVLKARGQEHCSEALCIKDMQKDVSKDSGTVSVNRSQTTYSIVSWRIENLTVSSKKEINPTSVRSEEFWKRKGGKI